MSTTRHISISCCQSRLLRAKRETSRAQTAPTGSAARAGSEADNALTLKLDPSLGADQEHAISLLQYTLDWQDEDRAKALESELEALVAEADEATGIK